MGYMRPCGWRRRTRGLLRALIGPAQGRWISPARHLVGSVWPGVSATQTPPRWDSERANRRAGRGAWAGNCQASGRGPSQPRLFALSESHRGGVWVAETPGQTEPTRWRAGLIQRPWAGPIRALRRPRVRLLQPHGLIYPSLHLARAHNKIQSNLYKPDS